MSRPGAAAGSDPREPDPRRDDPGALDVRPVHDGRIVDLSIDTVRFPDGSTGELEMIRHSGAAAVLPFVDPPTSGDPRIVLLRQYRYAAGGDLYEVPAGRPEGRSEPWKTCAARELQEETGYAADELVPLIRIFTTPGFTDEEIHLFAAHPLRRTETDLDPDEFVEVEELRLSRALEMVRDGRITDAKTICTLLYVGTFGIDGR